MGYKQAVHTACLYLSDTKMTNQHTPQAEEAQLDENQIIALRREKLNAIRAEGIRVLQVAPGNF